MKDYSLLIAPLVALIVGRLAMRAVRLTAIANGFVDCPDQHRKLQKSPIPLGGGIAIWLATWSAWGVSLWFLAAAPSEIATGWSFYAALAASSLFILVLGLADDARGMRGLHKLAGQVFAATLLVALGVRIDAVHAFGITCELGVFAFPVTVLWVVLVINAFNLIDGMDGFCGGIALVASLTIAFLSYWSGRPGDALISLALAAGLAAFLRDNLPPARIYMGDAGSMTVGLMISALSIRACTESISTSVSAPLLVSLVALPVLDVAIALCRRWLTGQSLFIPDRGHLHHRLRTRLGSTPLALSVGVGLAIFVAAGTAAAKVWHMGHGVAVLTIFTTVVLLAGTNTFGGSEVRLLIYRFKTAASTLLAPKSRHQVIVRQECHLVGVRDWSKVWDGLIRSVEDAGGRRVELAIDHPSVGETYHGIWTLSAKPTAPPHWSITHTLRVDDASVGTLKLAGHIDESRENYLDRVEKLIRELQDQLGEEFQRDLPGNPRFTEVAGNQFALAKLPGRRLARLLSQHTDL